MTIGFVMQATSDQVAAQKATNAAQNAAQARANADRAIESAIQEAERAARSVGQDVPPPAEPGEPVVFSTDEGRPVNMSFKNGTIFLTQDGHTQAIPLREAIPREAAQIAWAIPATLSILLIWWPLSRAVIRWLNRKHVANTETASLEARMRDRFETLERNLDTLAVEMERLSEGQRFTTKLLAERAEKDRVPVSGQV